MTGDMFWPYGVGSGAVDELLGRFLEGLDLDRMLSVDAVELLRRAIRKAGALGTPWVGTDHLLVAVTETGAGRAMLREAGVEPERVARMAEETGEHHGGAGDARLTLDADAEAALWEADRIAWVTGAWHIRPGHILLGLASDARTPAGRVLHDTDLPSLLPDRHGRDLTGLVRAGRLGRIVGRDHEIALAAATLARSRRNTPVLVGEPGVGKSAVVEGLAHWIVDGGVPESLRGTHIVQTDRPAAVLDRHRDHGTLVLFVHGMDDDVRRLLDRERPRVVIATSPARYQDTIGADRSLEDRAEPVAVPELAVQDTVTVLRDLRGEYEAQLGVRFDDDALTAVAELAGRYLRGRLPGKAVHLLERVGGQAGPRPERGPSGVDELERRVVAAAGGRPAPREPITAGDVADVVSGLAGVPLQRLT